MCKLFNWFFKNKKQSLQEDTLLMKKFLVVGLGNIGEKYHNTRHNIGFKILDFFASKENLVFETVKLADRADYKLKGRTFIFIKPNTYMNLSGKAVKYWLEKEKIPLERVLIITDDLALPFGKIRLRGKGSDGGHNGLKHINELLARQDYARLRFGIGNIFSKGKQVDYVLGEWNENELETLSERIEIASKAVGIEIPEEVELKDIGDFKLIGTSVKNVDGKKIVTGEPLFGLDFKREGMQLAVIQHPPAFGMKLIDFNEDEIKRMPGVKDAFMIDTTIDNPTWSDEKGFLQLIAIVGESTWQLMKAKRAIKANWETLSALENSEMHQLNLEEALKTGETSQTRKDGDPDAAFAKAAKVIERTYSSPFLAHNTMEPMNFFADVKENSAELIGPTQTPQALEGSVAKLLNLPIENIEVNMTRMGGGFGRRLYGDFALEAAEVSHLAKNPVKVVFSREDDMAAGIYRPAIKYRIAASVKDNKVTGYHLKEAAINSNMYDIC